MLRNDDLAIDCHSSTPKEDLISFVEKNKGKKIVLHYECNIYAGWGDDDIFTFDTNLPKHYADIIETIKTHYIHGIKVEGEK